jgi:hypothetical protein
MMPKYFLQLSGLDGVINDIEGAEFEDLNAALNEAAMPFGRSSWNR